MKNTNNKKFIKAPKTADFGFNKVAAAIPILKIGQIDFNTSEIISLSKKASASGASIVVFPELSITGYTLGDLFHQRLILDKARESLKIIAETLKTEGVVAVVGLPFECEGKIFNAAAIINRGEILGIVPKTYLPNYKEFYEKRWFASADDLLNHEVELFGQNVPIGTDILFKFKNRPEAVLGIEICEDLWVPIPPSSFQVLAGATIVANLSASNDLVGKGDYRRALVTQQSARGVCGYIYVSCGVNESTTDVVFGGHSIIAENGSVLAESKSFSRESQLVFTEIDLEHLKTDRSKTSSFGQSIPESNKKEFRFIEVETNNINTAFTRIVNSLPFVPDDLKERDKRAEEIFAIQTAGLAKRLEYTGINKVLVGLSGGLDSTLALLVMVRTFKLLSLPLKNIIALTMPGFATSKRTKNNAIKLAETLGVTLKEIDVTKSLESHFRDISHQGLKNQDVTFQNAQARYRTMILMDMANQIGGLVVGTGDLSELALGWCTFTGDHISHYNVNASVPKTLVKYLVKWVSDQKDFISARKTLKDIIDTPISPELTTNGKKKEIQKTEDLIGPYELHDFFLYHFVRWGSEPKKILFLAQRAFGNRYNSETIKKWLIVFVKRFFTNQWKRSVMPDGPKVGSVALSPRGDWRMPSDAQYDLWLKELLTLPS